MRCKPGDLAFVVKAKKHENIGKIVKVISPYDSIESRSPAWVCAGGNGFWTFDECLRPIRDNDGEDETLTWAPKPETVQA